jgi:hypothetical protein
LNADKNRYLNYETNTNGDIVGNKYLHCRDRERLNFFRLPKKFIITDGEYVRVRSPEVIALKENANIKIIVDEEGHLLASACSNTLPLDKPYLQLLGISIQRNIKRRQAYSCTNVINLIFTTYRNCYLCKK